MSQSTQTSKVQTENAGHSNTGNTLGSVVSLPAVPVLVKQEVFKGSEDQIQLKTDEISDRYSGTSSRVFTPSGGEINKGSKKPSNAVQFTQKTAIDNNEEATDLKVFKPKETVSPDISSDSITEFKPIQKKENKTRLPDGLKEGVENLSGISMENVKVHYNSSQPAQLNALAYAQGTDIHVAPGQERHLPHEAWHVVQQAQGRVKPTLQMKVNLSAPKQYESLMENSEHSLLNSSMLNFNPVSTIDPVQVASSGEQVIQAIIDAPAFRILTPARFANSRKAVTTIDAALDTYHASNQGNILANMNNLIVVIDAYILGKANDLGNPRLVPVGNLRAAAILERTSVTRINALHLNNVVAGLANIGLLAAIPDAELNALAALAQVNTVAALDQLHSLAKPYADTITVAGLQVNGHIPTIQDIAALDAVDLPKIVALANANLVQVTTWDELRQLAVLIRPAAVLISRAGALIGGNLPTLQQIILLGDSNNVKLNALSVLPQVTSWATLVTIAALTRDTAETVHLSNLQLAGLNPTLQQLVGFDTVPLPKIQTVFDANIAVVTTWQRLGRLITTGNRATETGAEIVELCQMDIGGGVPTWDQLMALAVNSLVQIRRIRQLPFIHSWAEAMEETNRLPQLLLQIVMGMKDTLDADLDGLAASLGVRPSLQNYIAILVDLNLPATNSQGYINDVTIYNRFFADSVNYNACFDGTDRLVATVGTENLAVTYDAGGGARQEYAQAQQAVRIEALLADLQAALAGAPVIFRVHLGGHGFTLVTQGGRIYQLETLAGSSTPGTLLQSIFNNYSYTLAEAQTNFRNIAGNSVVNRIQGAGDMHWNAGPLALLQPPGVYNAVKDPMTVYWTGSALQPRDQIITDFTHKMRENRRTILERLGIDMDV